MGEHGENIEEEYQDTNDIISLHACMQFAKTKIMTGINIIPIESPTMIFNIHLKTALESMTSKLRNCSGKDIMRNLPKEANQ